jgi:Flp pilus assembly protein TadG
MAAEIDPCEPVTTRTRRAEPIAALSQRWVRDEGGAVAMMVGLLAVVLLAMVGGAVDFARFMQTKAGYQDAVDAATLAAARVKQTGGSDADAFAAGQAYLAAIKARLPVDGAVNFQVTPDGTSIRAYGELALKTLFLPVIQMNSLPFTVGGQAKYGIGPDIELSLMLDVTGSMSGSKIQDLKDAVEDLITIVVQDSGEQKSRVAMAPFSHSVRLHPKHFRAVTGLTGGGYSGCVVERPGVEVYTDAAPGPGRHLLALEDVAPSAACNGARQVFPLSNNKNDLKRMVRGLNTGGMTAGHLGTAWAWYLLSPNWSDVFDSDERPADYARLADKHPNGSPKLRKIAVLMTDGVYNIAYNGVDSSQQAKAICAEMKKTGIEVFTIGFEVGSDSTVIETLKSCATSPTHFYNAESGAGLKAAFRDIALKSSPLRLTQ